MRAFIIAIIMSSSVFVVGDDRLEQSPATAALNDIVVEFASAQHRFGPAHPNTRELKRDIQARIDSGERLNHQKIDAKLSVYYRDYQATKDKLSIRHPRTQERLRNLSIAVKLLSCEPEFFAKNWEDLLAN